MRPLRLEISAFGPFADTEKVDFEALGPEALFLIHGATGSGKSTLLDAMCFGLYGQSLGGDRSGEQLRSDHAEPTHFTQVQFDFAVGSGRYRVTRSPEQTRVKARGAGTTVAKPKALLYDLVEEKPLVEGKRKVDVAIAKLLGFACDDFRQVVMLPQGRFRELLSAGSKERQQVLARIFRTDRFRDLIERLKKAHKALEAKAGEGQARVNQLLAGAEVEDLEGLAARIQKGHGECADLATELEGLTAKLKGAEEELKLLEAAHRLVDAHRKALADLETSKEDAPRVATLKARLALARKAEPLAARLSGLADRKEAMERLLAQVAVAESDAKSASEDLQEALQAKERALERQGDLPDLRKEEQSLGGLGDVLQTIRDLKAVCVQTVTNAETARLASERQAAISEDLGKKVAELERRIANRRAREEIERKVLAQRKRVETASQVAAHCLRLEAAEEVVVLKQGQQEALGEELREAREEAEAGRKVQIQDLAGSLAEGLEEGGACPVCGSTTHPDPAKHGTEGVSQSQLDALTRKIKNLEKDFDQAREAVSSEKQRKEGIKGMLDALDPIEEPLEDLKSDLAALEAGFQAAKEERSLEELEAELPGLQAQLEAAKKAGTEAYGDSLVALQDLKRDRAAVTEAEGRLPGEFRSVEQIEAKVAQVGAEITSIETLVKETQARHTEAVAAHGLVDGTYKQLLQQQDVAEKETVQEEEAVVAALQTAGFEDAAAWKAAGLTGVEQDAMDAQIGRAEGQHQAAIRAVELARAAVKGVTLEGNLEDKVEAVGLAEGQRSEAFKRLGRYEEAVEGLQSTYAQIQKLKAQSSEVEQRYAIAGHLADVAKGKTPAKLDFERYVLGVMLDDVLQTSGHRLQAMSRGRYTLHRSQSLEDGRRVAGLDLDVMDHWTGISRAVATLSGGEGFLAALALALGLADVIQSYTGGIHLEAVFVDEGFGSLDPEALEMAMRALEDLRESGRMVGLISHVAELKERIDTRIEVERSRKGSRIRVVRS